MSVFHSLLACAYEIIQVGKKTSPALRETESWWIEDSTTAVYTHEGLVSLTPKEVAGHKLGPPHEPLLSQGFCQLVLAVETYSIHL